MTLAPVRQTISRPAPGVDLPRATQAAQELLDALGIDTSKEGLGETPRRLAQALHEMTTGPDFELTTFPNTEHYDELVLVHNIAVHSVCEHHILPFFGVAHIGYLPGDRILGLSKFARMVQFHSQQPQTQERLTQEIAQHVQEALSPKGVGVVIQAEHTCMSFRGARSLGSKTVTSALYGKLRNDQRSRNEFLALTREQH